MTSLTVLWTYMQLQASRLRQLRDDERGAVTLEQIIVAAILAAAAIAAGTIIYNLTVNKANSIDTTTP
ncbi:MAG TPA: hypothetical protein VFJ85_01255 [Acidimicrobiales bacterium]|nr:hypothetical protein [Acidimicrobiales bacterium]